MNDVTPYMRMHLQMYHSSVVGGFICDNVWALGNDE
ncbi:hypothetical protein Taro_044512 [Colocasia esculenta]|uniref:Uncharacterized protein n=1 Tax=Colocasia esculenta TaxID=4460 RepID=A0A843X3E6_COLES|nr:hypothetical protein [Colocasia esculenta]